MAEIRLLEDHIINKIAAGEVVERPASVVKELLENSLDAGSTEIHIELAEGGKKRITLRDNGKGISSDQIQLALTRHATSKLASEEDLFTIQTMGFRGEALASIASISRFTLSSRQVGVDVGAKLQVEGGTCNEPLLPFQGHQGTTVNIEDLFFNVPARAKFLKSSTTEFSHCWDLVQSLAIAHPHVGFYLSHNGKEKFRAPAIPRGEGELQTEEQSGLQGRALHGELVLRARASHVWGDDSCESLLYVHEANQFGSFEGLISPPGLEKATSRQLLTFVNSRWVKDKTIRYGLMRGYQSHLLKGRFPMALVFFDCDPSLVDCNVHPAKTELRFQYSSEVQGLLSSGVRRVLRDPEWAVGSKSEREAGKAAAQNFELQRAKPSHEHVSFVAPSSQSKPKAVRLGGGHSSGGILDRTENLAGQSREAASAGLNFGETSAKASVAVRPRPSQREQVPLGSLLDEPVRSAESGDAMPIWSQLRYIGTFSKCYLLFEGGSQLLVVDQHAFHERILFEKLMCDRSLLLSSQGLLVPEVIDLSPESIEYLQENEQQLQESGFDYQVLDAQCVEIKAVPVILSGKQFEALFEDMSHPSHQGLSNEPVAASLGQLRLATIACHSAVKAGEDLSFEEVTALIAEAHEVDFFHNCPHGRRVFRWFSKRNVESWFDR